MSQEREKNQEPAKGLKLAVKVESGKALIECWLQSGRSVEIPSGCGQWEVCIQDEEERLVFRAVKPLEQEESIRGVLLRPQLWQGAANPYRYRIRAKLKQQAQVMEVLEKAFAIRTFEEVPVRGWLLNEEPFEVRAVFYELSPEIFRLRRDVELIRNMGANTLWLGKCQESLKEYEMLQELCDEMGLLLCCREKDSEEVCADYSSLVEDDTYDLTDSYYHYKGKWSKEPFVYISLESLEIQQNGNVRVTVYSNAGRAALYVDGVLFGFQTDGPDFVFEEIPMKHLPLMLTAEIRECSMSVCVFSIHKNFTE